jgi:hypothetical protein
MLQEVHSLGEGLLIRADSIFSHDGDIAIREDLLI